MNKPDLIKEYNKADIFVLPSYYEGMPLVILEAMSAGLPIIATNISTLPEIIENNTNGLLIEAGNANHLADAIKKISESPALRGKMSKNNIKKARKMFNSEIFCRKINKIYKKL